MCSRTGGGVGGGREKLSAKSEMRKGRFTVGFKDWRVLDQGGEATGLVTHPTLSRS
jgi:hypothetical protein